tara:strand:- start:665 stop:805 length:141 start_codon:yes stop_codon:yes gene_type:complete
MSLLKFIEKEPKFVMMEEMLERLEKEPQRQYKWIRENHTRKRSRSE